jgi:ribonuclease HI
LEHPLVDGTNPIEGERHTADMIAYVDGGSRGNPGPAGIGVVIEHPTGRRVEISQSICGGDNNYAEYAALLVALEYAAAHGSPRLEVFSDSEVVVRQITGSYNCQSPLLREIHDACRAMIAKFQDFAITHIRRENNAAADRLAKEAMERAALALPDDSEHSGFLEDTMTRVAGRLGTRPRLIPVEQTG